MPMVRVSNGGTSFPSGKCILFNSVGTTATTYNISDYASSANKITVTTYMNILVDATKISALTVAGSIDCNVWGVNENGITQIASEASNTTVTIPNGYAFLELKFHTSSGTVYFTLK